MSDDPTRTRTGDGGPDHGTIIAGRYEQRRLIGEGGMGEVFEGFDRETNRPVALKRPPREVWINPLGRERFLREARIGDKLRHPNIVEFFGVADEGLGRPVWLVFEYIDGVNLLEYLARKNQPMAPDRAAATIIQACAGLAHAHAQGIVHRDIKPSNLMIDRQGRVKVADFGIAREVKNTLFTLTGRATGTLGYMPPEQELGQDKDPRVDVYALGATLYEMLTGRGPFAHIPNTLAAKERKAWTPMRELNPDIPDDLATLVYQCLEPDPRHRLAGVKELSDSLYRLVPGHVQALPEALRPKPKPPVPPPGEWFYRSGGRNVGPLTKPDILSAVRTGALGRTGLVWKEGMADWARAGDVAELSGLFPASEAPVAPVPQPRVPNNVPEPKAAGAAGRRGRRRALTAVALLLGLLLALFFIRAFPTKVQDVLSSGVSPSAPSEYARRPGLQQSMDLDLGGGG